MVSPIFARAKSFCVNSPTISPSRKNRHGVTMLQYFANVMRNEHYGPLIVRKLMH